jgi:Helix-hairpin-helix motif
MVALEAIMKNKLAAFFVAGIGVGIALRGYFVLKNVARRNRAANLHLTSKDLDYSDVSRDELVASHLIDLNSAEIDKLNALGLDAQSADRLIENRPYRNKLDLLSRMILPQETYAAIKDKIGVAGAREPIKIA